ncbi:MAG TPA: hypothetical protein VGS27_20465 [Candidatus Sulfotelmatobacter sp.]|nr:hypothetical protein [Candidatus Sulfotelmatobacter sp.]
MSILDELRNNLRLTSSFVAALIFFLTIIVILIAWRDDMALLAAIVGSALGWAAGILIAPYEGEGKRFRSISKGIAGFLTGYAIGKIDRVFDLLLDKTDGAPAILDMRLQRTFWLGLACFVVTALTVFVARTYCDDEEEYEGGYEQEPSVPSPPSLA